MGKRTNTPKAKRAMLIEDNDTGPSRENPLVDSSSAQNSRKQKSTPESTPNNSAKKRKRTVVVESSSEDESGGIWKHLKIETFPTGIPAAQKWQKWLDWFRKFRIVTSNAGKMTNRQKADMLYVTAGEEVQTVINVKGLYSDDLSIEDPFTPLEQGLATYFKGLTSPAINWATLDSMKQKPGETARDFQLRLVQQAAICGMTADDPLLGIKFINGLSDRFVARQANTHGMSMEAAAEAASREEAINQGVVNAQRTEEDTQMVAAVGGSTSGKSNNPIFRARASNAQQRRGSPFTKRQRGGGVKLEEKCGYCGYEKHPMSGCPARGKECASCGTLNHFARVCKKKKSISQIEGNDEEDQQHVNAKRAAQVEFKD